MNETLLSALSLLATPSFWQHLPFFWVQVKYPFGFEEESNTFTAHLILVILGLQRKLCYHAVNEVQVP